MRSTWVKTKERQTLKAIRVESSRHLAEVRRPMKKEQAVLLYLKVSKRHIKQRQYPYFIIKLAGAIRLF